MRKECIQAVRQAVGRALTQLETRDIEERIASSMRRMARQDPQGWMSKSSTDRLQEAGQEAAKELMGEARLKQQRAALTVLAHGRIQRFVSDQQAKGMGSLEALDRLIAFHADNKGNTISIESQARAIERDALRQMLGTLTASNPKWFGLFENLDGVRAIVKEIFGEPSGDAAAAAGGKQWHAATAALRARFNRAGGDVGELEDWGLPHHHSQTKVAKAGRNAWIADVLGWAGRDHYYNEDGTRMTDAQLSDFLGHAWTTIATGGANKMEPGQFSGGGARANRGNQSRQVHFKDADSYMAYQEKYGERSLYEVLVGHIANVSKDVALVETFGPNPDHTFRAFRDTALREGKLADPTTSGKLDERAIKTENLYNTVAGKTQPVANEHLANTFDTLRSWLVASRLGSAVITSMSDDATLYLTGKLNNLPQMRLMANELAALNPVNRMEERMALRAGLAMSTLVSSLNRFGQNGLGASFAKKLANTVLRVSGLNAITEARKRAFGVTMMSSLGAVTREHPDLAALDANDHRILLSKGITEGDFAVWKAAQLENWGGGNDTMLTPESIYRIPDAALDPIIAPRVAALKAEADAHIQELQNRNTEDQGWAAKRTANLRQWVQDMQGRLAQQSAKADEQTKERFGALRRRLGALYDQLDTANSYFKETQKNQVNLAELRRAGVAEGRNQGAIDQVASTVRKAMRDTESLKGELDKAFVEKFAAKEQEINTLLESGDERRIAFALDKFDELFVEANAKLTDRLSGADERLTARINAAVEKVAAIREKIGTADALWNRANAARPGFGDLRSQGVSEGRAQESAKNLKAQIRDITRELQSWKQGKALDLAEQWAAKKAELDEFTQRADERAQRRQLVIDRITREIDPAIAAERTKAREQAATKLLGAVLEETDVAVIEPGVREHAMTSGGTQKGTWKGELTRSFFLFKSFPLAMIQRHWARGMSLPNVGGRAAYIATLMAATTVAGAVSLQVGEVLAGRDPRNLNPFEKGGVRNWIAALLKGGSLGIYGDFLFSDATQHGSSPLATLEGPVIGSAEDLLNLTQGNIMKATQGKKTHFGANVVKLVKSNLPGASLWYAKAALDHLIFNQLSEYFSPGYLATMRARAQREFGQHYWWEPGDAAPDRAPDMAAMAGK